MTLSHKDEETEAVSLEPCPFCGGEASDEGHIRFSKPLNDAWWPGDVPITEAFYVNCIKCGAVSRSGIVGGYQTKAEAIIAWNRRVSTNKDETIAKMLRLLERAVPMIPDFGAGTPASKWHSDIRDLFTSTKKEG